MMGKQALEFVEGYIFGKVEDSIKCAHINKLEIIAPVIVYVPKAWFGLRPIKDKSEMLGLGAKFEIERDLYNLCSSYNTPQSKYFFSFYTRPDEQYICFVIGGTRLPAEKEMTIEEIEKELGYKIKIVG